MQKISKDEFDQLFSRGRGKVTPLRTTLLEIAPGEAVIIKKKDWKVKYSPFKIAGRIERTYGISFKKVSLADGTGWAIQRL